MRYHLVPATTPLLTARSAATLLAALLAVGFVLLQWGGVVWTGAFYTVVSLVGSAVHLTRTVRPRSDVRQALGAGWD